MPPKPFSITLVLHHHHKIRHFLFLEGSLRTIHIKSAWKQTLQQRQIFESSHKQGKVSKNYHNEPSMFNHKEYLRNADIEISTTKSYGICKLPLQKLYITFLGSRYHINAGM